MKYNHSPHKMSPAHTHSPLNDRIANSQFLSCIPMSPSRHIPNIISVVGHVACYCQVTKNMQSFKRIKLPIIPNNLKIYHTSDFPFYNSFLPPLSVKEFMSQNEHYVALYFVYMESYLPTLCLPLALLADMS